MSAREQRLIRVYQDFASDIARLRSTFETALDGQYSLDSGMPPVSRSAACYCLVELHDSWTRFCKRAVLVSAKGRVLTRQGTTVQRSGMLGPRDDPEHVLKQLWIQAIGRWPMFGIAWDIPARTVQAAQLLAINNAAQFVAGIGALSSAPSELKACRNFLAHRNSITATHNDIQALRQRIGAPVGTASPGSLAARFVPGGITLFEEWCIDLNALAAAALA